MSDPLSWSPISLGRWFGTSVRVHITLIIFVVFRLLSAAVSLAAKGELPQLSQTACWLGLLLLALALHELGHAVTAAWLDCDQGEVEYLAARQPGRAVIRAPFQREFPGRDGGAGRPTGRLSWRSLWD